MAPPAPEFARCIETFETELDFIFRCLRRYGVNGADAEDLAQDIFFIMWRRWGSFDASRPLRPWLAGIAYKITRRHQRKSGRFILQPAVDKPDESPTAEDIIESARASTRVHKALSSMSEKQRTVLTLHDIEGVPMREIASRLDVPLFTAYSRLRLARETFADRIDVTRERRQKRDMLVPASLFDWRSSSTCTPADVRLRILGRIRAAGPEHRLARRPFVSSRHLWRTLSTTAGLGLLGVVALLIQTTAERKPFERSAAPTPRSETMTVASSVARSQAKVRPSEKSGLALASPAVTPAEEQIARGLVAYWRFDDDRLARWAHDSSGHGHDCVLRGENPSAAWVDGTLGGAMEFAQHRWLECIDGEPAASAPKEISGAAWVRRTRLRGEKKWALIARRMASTPHRYFLFGFLGDALTIESNAWHGGITRPFPGQLGQWVHVAFTHDATGLTRLFIGGAEVGRAQNSPAAVSGENALLTIGAFSTPESGIARAHFDGNIDELLLYDRALGTEEIQALAARVQPRFRPSPEGPLGAAASTVRTSDGTRPSLDQPRFE